MSQAWRESASFAVKCLSWTLIFSAGAFVLGGWLYLLIAMSLNMELSAADLDQSWKGFFWLLLTVLAAAWTRGLINNHG